MATFTLKEQVCKRISDTLAGIVREGKLVRRTSNSKGIFIHDGSRSEFIKLLAEDLLVEKEIFDAISSDDLQHIIFDALRMTQNKSNMQDRATAAAKLLLEQRQIKK